MTHTTTVLDLFGGPGGWDVAARAMGARVLGVEIDSAACATRDAAGHPTLQADVAMLEPKALGNFDGVVASPPCPAYSNGGLRLGLGDRPAVEGVLRAMASGDDERLQGWRGMADPSSLLVVEPYRYVRDLQPQWLVCEQVPAVLPLWQVMAECLHGLGYSTWTGVVDAQWWAVPQRRRRAVLLASYEHAMFSPEPEPHSRRSVADVLGWAPADRLGFARRNDKDDGHAYRQRDLAPCSGPALTLTGKARSWQRHLADGTTAPLALADASALQGFDALYPWRGSRSAAFLQVANAVPPPMAQALLQHVTDPPV